MPSEASRRVGGPATAAPRPLFSLGLSHNAKRQIAGLLLLDDTNVNTWLQSLIHRAIGQRMMQTDNMWNYAVKRALDGV